MRLSDLDSTAVSVPVDIAGPGLRGQPQTTVEVAAPCLMYPTYNTIRVQQFLYYMVRARLLPGRSMGQPDINRTVIISFYTRTRVICSSP